MTSSTHKLVLNLTKSPGVEVPLDILMGTPFPALSRTLGQEHVPVDLYDLKADPREQRNLAGKPELAEMERELKARLLRWMTETEDPILQGAITPPFQVQALQALKEP